MRHDIVLFILLVTSGNVFSSTFKNEGQGKVSVNGQILSSACSIHTDDMFQEIAFDFNSVENVVNNTGENKKNFVVRLVNCRLDKKNESEWKSISVTFDGATTENDDSLFSVAGNAGGIALRLISAGGEQAIPGVAMGDATINNNSADLHYQLQIVPDGSEFTEGSWTGSLRYMVSYY